MKQIENLDDLRKVCSEETVKKIFTEYMLEQLYKATQFDNIAKSIDKCEDINEIKDML